MNGNTIQGLQWLGASISASISGLPFSLFRPASSSSPVSGTPLATLSATFDFSNNTYSKPPPFPAFEQTGLWDGSQTQPGDYLVEVTPRLGQAARTFFINSMEALVPMQVIPCSKVITIQRPQSALPTGPMPTGKGTYSGLVESTMLTLLENWPCGYLLGTKGEADENHLPTATRSGWFYMFLPSTVATLASDIIRTGDIVTDGSGLRYEVSTNETKRWGVRLTVAYKGA